MIKWIKLIRFLRRQCKAGRPNGRFIITANEIIFTPDNVIFETFKDYEENQLRIKVKMPTKQYYYQYP